MDTKAQISMEYLLLFMIFLIIFSTITIPLLTSSIDEVNDVTRVMETKVALTQISKNVKIVYALGGNSAKSISIYMPENMTIRRNTYNNRHYISSSLKLSDNTTKYVNVEVPCNVSFNGNLDYYYCNVKNRWYYNTDIKWIEKNNKRGVNINIK